MWPFSKSRSDWEACPDWDARYDFVVKGDVTETTPKALHQVRFDSTAQRLRAALRGQKWLLHFTAFVYDDPGLGECNVTREELCQAFTTLVQGWHKLLRRYAEYLHARDTHPFKDSPTTLTTLADHMDILTDGEGVGRFGVLVWDTWLRLAAAANYFGQYLSFLSDMEDKAKLPSFWRRYPGPIDENSVRLKATGRYRMRVRKGTIDDYAFRAARIINSDKPLSMPPVEEALQLLRDMAGWALSYKGYSEEDITAIFAKAESCPTSFVPQSRLFDVVPTGRRKPWEKYFDRVDPASKPVKLKTPASLPSIADSKPVITPPPYSTILLPSNRDVRVKWLKSAYLPSC